MARPAPRRHTAGMPSVFLVDDSPLVRERLHEMLGSVADVQIVGQATTAAEAVFGILDARPDIVLLDLSLAEGSGFDVLRAIRDQAPEIEVYLLSNFAAYPYRQLAERLGARGFFDKSSEFGLMRDVIARRAAVMH